MTEEIIIDGIDVSGCSIFNNKTKVCMYSRETCNAICDYGCYARNEIIERLEQKNKGLQAYKDVNEDFKKAWDELNEKYKQLRSALEEIRNDIMSNKSVCTECIKIAKRIDEVLNNEA